MDDPDPLIATRLHQRLGSAAPLAGSRRSLPLNGVTRRTDPSEVSSVSTADKPRCIEKKKKVASAPFPFRFKGKKKKSRCS